MPGVFLNYRVGDGEYSASLVDRELSSRIGPHNVFRASRSIPPGADFATRILAELSQSDVVVAFIGPHWLVDAAGRRRIHDKEDWVRRELAEAIRREITVIPVLVGGASRLTAADLPTEIRPLAGRQYLQLNHRTLDSDLTRLIDVLIKHVPALVQEPMPAGDTDPEARHHLILGLDFRGSDSGSDLQTLAVRDRVYRAIRDALREALIPADSCVVRDRGGDTALILVPADIPEARVVGVWVDQLHRELRTAKGPQVRIGVHSGQVHADAHGVAGADVDLALRLGSSDVARSLARAAHGARLVVIVSDRVYQSVVRHGGRFIEPESYGEVDVAGAPAWAHIPGWSVPPRPRDEPGGPVQPDRPEPSTNGGGQVVTINGPGTAIGTATASRDLVIGTVHNYARGTE